MCLAPTQVSDQLVEINGSSTAGMTHSQAVEQIRRGGHRIHLVLKKGDGYVPDYGEEGAGTDMWEGGREKRVLHIAFTGGCLVVHWERFASLNANFLLIFLANFFFISKSFSFYCLFWVFAFPCHFWGSLSLFL